MKVVKNKVDGEQEKERVGREKERIRKKLLMSFSDMF